MSPRKPGRPPRVEGEAIHRLHVKLSTSELAQLDALAASLGVDRSAAIRAAVRSCSPVEV